MLKNLCKNNFIIFFSLPFYRQSKKNFFFHGHLAIGLDKYVFQVYNPKLLRSNFLISKMPIKHWLFKDGKFFDNRKDSPTFKYVHLYKKAETKKTIVYYAATNLQQTKIQEFQDYMQEQENKYQQGKIDFNLIQHNCVTIINSILYSEKWLNRGIFDFIPVILFKKLIKSWRNKNIPFNTGKISGNMLNSFKLHKFCIGIPTSNPQKHLDSYLKKSGFFINITSS